MPNEPYENDAVNLPEDENPADGNGTYEEFDISSFDFTIADPGDQGEYASTPEATEATETGPSGERPKKTKKRFSFSALSAAISEKAEKLMEESPREEKPKKEKISKEKPQKIRRESPEISGEREDPPSPPKEKKERQRIDLRSLRIPFTKESLARICRRWLRYALRPAALYENITESYWPMFLAGVGVYFAAFYLLIGLDWYFADLVSAGRLWAVTAVGLLVGGVAATTFAAGAQGLSLICRKERIRPFRTFASLAGACVYPSSLLILGFLLRVIFPISVSMSFGVISLLWTVSNVLEVLREQFGEKHLFKSVVLTVLWAFLLFAVMTITFTLK